MSANNVIARGVIPARRGVVGFEGTARLAASVGGDGQVFYVDAGHANANDVNDGTDPEAPMATLQALLTRMEALNAGTATREPVVQDFDTIYIHDHLVESAEILSWANSASYVNLVGAGQSKYGPTWQSDAVDAPCFIAGGVGWTIQNFRFMPGNAAAGIVIPNLQAPHALGSGTRTVVKNCWFDGNGATGLYGIDLHGAPWLCEITDCVFEFFNNGANSATAIASTNTGTADAFRTLIEHNRFHANDNHINASLNVSQILNNVFETLGSVAAILVIDLRTGTVGRNIVAGNHFGAADYSQAGGFYPNAANPGGWVGNTSADIAEAEVADNGITIAPPA